MYPLLTQTMPRTAPAELFALFGQGIQSVSPDVELAVREALLRFARISDAACKAATSRISALAAKSISRYSSLIALARVLPFCTDDEASRLTLQFVPWLCMASLCPPHRQVENFYLATQAASASQEEEGAIPQLPAELGAIALHCRAVQLLHVRSGKLIIS